MVSFSVYHNLMLTIQVVYAKSYWAKIQGLIGKTQPESIFFQTRWGIHTFGLKFPIDVVILDDNYIVKNMKQNLRPNSLFFWNPKYKNVLELPHGTIQEKKIRLHNTIKIQSPY